MTVVVSKMSREMPSEHCPHCALKGHMILENCRFFCISRSSGKGGARVSLFVDKKNLASLEIDRHEHTAHNLMFSYIERKLTN